MKATDYLDKWYGKLINSGTNDNKVIAEIITDFGKELKEIALSRNVQCDKAFISLFKEQCQKYNKFCRLVNEKLGVAYLKENGLKKYWISQIPELEKYLIYQEGR